MRHAAALLARGITWLHIKLLSPTISATWYLQLFLLISWCMDARMRALCDCTQPKKQEGRAVRQRLCALQCLAVFVVAYGLLSSMAEPCAIHSHAEPQPGHAMLHSSYSAALPCLAMGRT